jgi:hypothetical protein
VGAGRPSRAAVDLRSQEGRRSVLLRAAVKTVVRGSCGWHDGRTHAGAWLCRHCGSWHWMGRNPVRRGTSRTLREALKAMDRSRRQRRRVNGGSAAVQTDPSFI